MDMSGSRRNGGAPGVGHRWCGLVVYKSPSITLSLYPYLNQVGAPRVLSVRGERRCRQVGGGDMAPEAPRGRGRGQGRGGGGGGRAEGGASVRR